MIGINRLTDRQDRRSRLAASRLEAGSLALRSSSAAVMVKWLYRVKKLGGSVHIEIEIHQVLQVLGADVSQEMKDPAQIQIFQVLSDHERKIDKKAALGVAGKNSRPRTHPGTGSAGSRRILKY